MKENNTNDERKDSMTELHKILELLKGSLCSECEVKRDYEQFNKKQYDNCDSIIGDFGKEDSGKGESLGEKAKAETLSGKQRSDCETKKRIKRLKGFFKYKKHEQHEQQININDKDFVGAEMDKIRPKITTNSKNFTLFFLLFLLFVPLALFYGLEHDNNKLVCNELMNLRDSIDYKSKNDSNSINVTIQDTAGYLSKQNGKLYFVRENKQKDFCCFEIFLGIGVIILMGCILFISGMYIKYLRKKHEHEMDIDSSILEFNKRIYVELLRIRTSESAIEKQIKEQDLELYRQSELMSFEEQQKNFEHERKKEMRCIDLGERYLDKATEIVNKYFESRMANPQ